MQFVGMMTSGTTRVLLAAIFTAAMFYASLCSTACAAGFCPLLGRDSDTHECHHQASSHPGSSHQSLPERSNCSAHGHPNVFVNAVGFSQYRPTSVSYNYANSFIARLTSSAVAGQETLWGADLAPPQTAKNLLYRQVCVLRI